MLIKSNQKKLSYCWWQEKSPPAKPSNSQHTNVMDTCQENQCEMHLHFTLKS